MGEKIVDRFSWSETSLGGKGGGEVSSCDGSMGEKGGGVESRMRRPGAAGEVFKEEFETSLSSL